jgi:flagellar hook-associated protein 3 FlgL
VRISNGMVASNIQGYLFQHTRKLLQSQERIASGKRINRPSDDPVGMGQAMGYRKSIASLNQYNRNITHAKVYIDNVENILGSITEFLTQAKKIAADPHPDMRGMLADQVAGIREQVLQLSNSKHDGNYIFSGHNNQTAPFALNTVTEVYEYVADDANSKNFIIGDGLELDIVADGGAIFFSEADDDDDENTVFNVLLALEQALNDDDPELMKEQLQLIGDAIENLNTVRAVNAGKYKRLEATENHNKRFLVNAEDLLSRIEDTDMAAAIVDWQLEQTAYESTLAIAAKIIRPSLIDFLR